MLPRFPQAQPFTFFRCWGGRPRKDEKKCRSFLVRDAVGNDSDFA
jgi:hypothetical protein